MFLSLYYMSYARQPTSFSKYGLVFEINRFARVHHLKAIFQAKCLWQIMMYGAAVGFRRLYVNADGPARHRSRKERGMILKKDRVIGLERLMS